jgi:hypothetical protein
VRGAYLGGVVMGDRRRFKVLAEFIRRNHAPCRVADVAGGQGLLSLELAAMGFDCTVIDPRATDLPRSLRGDVRKGKSPGFKRIRGMFTNPDGYDLIVGLHPDGATETVIHAATLASVIVVPCCNYWNGPEIEGSSVTDAIRKVWMCSGIAWRETDLPMRGMNRVLWTK